LSKKALRHLIATGTPETWRTLAGCHGVLPLGILESLVDTQDPETAVLVAGGYRVNAELLMRLASSDAANVVDAVASRQYFGREGKATQETVDRVLVQNPLTPGSFIGQVADRATDDATLHLAVRHPNFPEVSLITYAEGSDQRWIWAAVLSGNARAIEAVASNAGASAETLRFVATRGGDGSS